MVGLIQFGIFLILLLVGFVAGRTLEARHLASIREREQRTASMLVVPMARIPGLEAATDSELVAGSVVISIDYFKRFVASLRALLGGRIAAYESLLDRGRREAMLRMKEEALRKGFHAVVCVRVESSRLASALQNGKGTAGVEVLAYGTALRLPPHSPYRKDGAGATGLAAKEVNAIRAETAR